VDHFANTAGGRRSLPVGFSTFHVRPTHQAEFPVIITVIPCHHSVSQCMTRGKTQPFTWEYTSCECIIYHVIYKYIVFSLFFTETGFELVRNSYAFDLRTIETSSGDSFANEARNCSVVDVERCSCEIMIKTVMCLFHDKMVVSRAVNHHVVNCESCCESSCCEL